MKPFWHTNYQAVAEAKKTAYQKAVESFREGVLFFSADLSDFSDEEIEDAIWEAHKALVRASPTVQEAIDGIDIMRCSLKKEE